jgi:hypothetical protein
MGKVNVQKEDVAVESHGHKFILRPYKHWARREIKNESFKGDEFLRGNFQDGVVFYSLASWDLQDEKGNFLKLDKKNFDEFFPDQCMDDLYAAALELNKLPEDEKNASSGQSATT